ncbi:MAG: hypothetical protein BGO33_13365 [Bacteroidia bacterium 43-41]|nr:MAG: hypothetical protein BGO33_13365 [Bacteroidia bacterium 43-41]
MKKTAIKLLIFLIPVLSYAQSGYDPILQSIEKNNTTLSALREQTEAQKVGNKTGIFLPNPEVMFNYLWSNPKTVGNRTDVSVTQSFDFPTAYGYKRDIADLQNSNAEYAYEWEKLKLLLSAKNKVIELIFYNAMINEYAVRRENAEKIANTYKSRLEKGDANILEVNKAQLNLTKIETEMTSLEAERIALISELKRMNGGNEIFVEQNEFIISPLPDNFDSWYSDTKIPMLNYMKGQIDIAEEQVKLARALSLPKFNIGYMSEKIIGEHFQGVTVGVSIPLWENKNSQKFAKARMKTTQVMLDDSKVQFYNNLQRLYLKASALEKNLDKFKQSISTSRNDTLLKIALDKGEISLLDYLLEIGHYYDAVIKILETERDYELAVAEFMAIELL